MKRGENIKGKKATKKTTAEFKAEVKEKFGDEYTVLGEYTGYKNKILIRHNKCGREFEAEPNRFLNCGRTCKMCSYAEGRKKNFINTLKELYDDKYELVGEFTKTNENITLRCKKCGEVFTRYGTNITSKTYAEKVNGILCPICSESGRKRNKTKSGKKSKKSEAIIKEESTIKKPKRDVVKIKANPDDDKFDDVKFITYKAKYKTLDKNKDYTITEEEKDIQERKFIRFIKKIYDGKIIKNSKKITKSQNVLSLYFPDLKIAFVYSRLDNICELEVGRNFLINITDEAKENYDIRVIHIFEDEWILKRRFVKDKIKTTLGMNSKVIYARKCIIKEISPNEKNDFLNDNHIQGKDNSSIKLGLYTNPKYYGKAKLVSVMTFCKPRKSLGQTGKNDLDLELSRYASLLGYNVVGGFSKLIKYFGKSYDWNKIITYADLRWSAGNVYLTCGFKNTHLSKPSYWYFKEDTIKREYRYAYRKTALLEKLGKEIYDPIKTEVEMMYEAGYNRLFDCGNMVFTLTNKYREKE